MLHSPKSDIPTSNINKNYINPKKKSPQSRDEREKEGSPSFKRSHTELFKSIGLHLVSQFQKIVYIYIDINEMKLPKTCAKSPD